MIDINCSNCNVIFKIYPYKLKDNKNNFCSNSCRYLFYTGNKNMRWIGGLTESESSKKYYYSKKGKEKRLIRQKNYVRTQKTKDNFNKWKKNYKKINIHYHIKVNISSSVRSKLINHDSKKDQKVLDCLPYTISELKEHLEKLFQPGMTWKNYGKWHIDHKIPDVSFDYKSTKDESFKKSWALENLQPLWAIDNLKKGSKIIA